MGGGIMFRAAGRAVGAGIGPKPTPLPSLPSSASVPVNVTGHRCAFEGDVSSDWELLLDDKKHDGFSLSASSHRNVFGPVPSKHEVQTAVSTLQQVVAPYMYSQLADNSRLAPSATEDVEDQIINPTEAKHLVPSAKSNLHTTEPALHFDNPKISSLKLYDNVFGAFQLLRTSPSIQRLVISLSSDQAVWDAVMNNEAVKELKESFYTENNQLESFKEEPQLAEHFFKWIIDNTKAKVAEILDKILNLMKDLFGQEMKKSSDIFEENIRSSLMLSIMVLLVIVVTRVQNA